MNLGRRDWPWWRCAVTALSAMAFALSSYLAWHYLSGRSVIGCGGGSSCDQVLTSRWSSVGGVVPVSGLGAGAYLAIFLASFFIGPDTSAPDRRLAVGAMLVLAGAAGGSAAWFTIVQKWMIGALCPYCMATHLMGVLVAVIVIWRAPRQFAGELRNEAMTNPAAGSHAVALIAPPAAATRQRLIDPLPAMGLALAGLTSAAIMAACQIRFAPPAVYQGGQSQQKLAALDAHAGPVIGSPDAPFVVALLFDYECPHCQKIHSMLDDVIARSRGKLAFALFPAPLDGKCNPYVAREAREFEDSCELARIALSVWVANREKFAAFDRWMFLPDRGHPWRARSLDAARAKAIELVGRHQFDDAQADPWINQYLQSSIQTYGQTLTPAPGGNAVPKLVFGSHWVIPQAETADDLLLILHKALAVPTP